MQDKIYIRQRNPAEDFYQQLQRQSLERLQGMAGELWTDYNAHDPGVTITDLLNYTLTELDYRLKFDLPDYLVAPDGKLDYREFGLFPATEVFPVTPVTPADYRKLIIDAVDEVENLWIYPSGEPGWYEILVELVPEAGFGSREKVKERVERIYQENRNLGEGLRRVLFVERKPLILQGNIDISPETNAPRLLTEIYWEALQFFIAGIRYRRVEDLMAEGKTPDEWLEGPPLKHWAIDEDSLKPLSSVYSVSRLYRRLTALKGVKDIRSLGFRDGDRVYTDLIPTEQAARSYTVLVPVKREDSGLVLLVGNTPVELDFTDLPEKLYARHARSYGYQNRTMDLTASLTEPEGRQRAIYTHDSVQNDFPDCYGINRMGLASGSSEERKAQARQLKAYLLLFDEAFARGLRELENIPRMLNVDEGLVEEGILPLEEAVVQWEQLTTDGLADGGNSRQLGEKGLWADMLDRMYGEDSNPGWLKAFNYYEDTREERLKRRFRFLGRLPEWGRNRFKGIDLYRNYPGNVPGVKAYVSCLLGFETVEEQPVINVFPQYNLKLVEDELFYRFRQQLLSHNLVPAELIREEYMEYIPLAEADCADEDYYRLRQALPLLHYNLLFEGLFRGGIRIESFRLLNLPMQADRLLLFYHSRRKEWINLGRFTSRQEVIDVANCLRRFLVMLNRRSEALYVVEHFHLGVEGACQLTVVFPGWSARMADPGFREACEKLVSRRLPAHLEVCFRWCSPREMWTFERVYYEWRRDLAAGNSGRESAGRLREWIM